MDYIILTFILNYYLFQAIGGMDFSALTVKMDVNNVQVAQYVRFVIKGNQLIIINFNYLIKLLCFIRPMR